MHSSRLIFKFRFAGRDEAGRFKTVGFEDLQRFAGLLATQAIRHSRPTMLQGTADDGCQGFRSDDCEDFMAANCAAEDFFETVTRSRECLTFGRTNRRRIVFSGPKKSRKSAANFGFRQSLPESLVDVAEFGEFLHADTTEGFGDGVSSGAGGVDAAREHSVGANSSASQFRGGPLDFGFSVFVERHVEISQQSMLSRIVR
jgi:hypothetical protein